ncbi:hypothetical protein MP213Fo_08450 [Pseudochrobactrum sp. MP213Fo]
MISAIMSDVEVIKINRAYDDAISCRLCGSCKRPIEANEAVWRMRINHRRSPFGVRTYDTLPCCEACTVAQKWRIFEDPAPCEHCARPVHNEWRQIDRKHVYCCTKCEQKAQISVAKQKRTNARETRQCMECSQTFPPVRIDAKFCSSPCRQKAYRKRVTDIKCV